MGTKTITVTWMDGVAETYPRVTVSVRDGVLHIHQYSRKVPTLIIREWHHPTTNIRTWEPAGQGGPAEEE